LCPESTARIPGSLHHPLLKEYLVKAIPASITALLILIAAICTSPIQANAQTFQPSVNISNSVGGVEDQQVTANGNGLFVVWADRTDGNFEIFFRRSTDGGITWGQASNLSTSPITSRFPQIAVSGNNVFIVWDDFTDLSAPHKVMLRRSTDGGATFLPVQQLSDDPPSGQFCFSNLAASGSLVFPYWVDCRPDTFDQTYYRRSLNAGVSFDPITLTPGNGGTFATRIIVNGNNVYILTSSAALPSGALLLRRSLDGGATFDAAKTIWPTSVDAAEIAANGNSVYVVFRPQAQFGSTNVNFIRSTDAGANFTSPINLSNLPSNVSAHSARLKVVDQQIFVVWSESDSVSGTPPFPAVTDTYFRKSVDGGVTFSPKINLSNNKTSVLPAIGVTSDGVYVSWLNTDNITPRINDVILRISNDLGSTFNPAVNMSASGLVDSPGLVVSDSNVYITWRGPSVTSGLGDVFVRRSTPAPILFTYENSERAIALDSVTMARDPFPITTTLNFSADQRTRLMLFAANAALLPGESASVITAQAEDAQHRIFPLPVEAVRQVPGFDWLTQINVKLPDELINAGDVQVSISVRGLVSNKAIVSIKPTDTTAP
jgi:hypothetical protein